MTPVDFPEANLRFKAPVGLEQVQTIAGYSSQVERGSLDGASICVVAWRPTPEELNALICGEPIYLAMIGGLLPHYLGTSFKEVTNCA